MDVVPLLQKCVEAGASDLHLSQGTLPFMRINGDLLPITDTADFKPAALMESLAPLMTSYQQEHLKQHLDVDFALDLGSTGRFRVNVFHEWHGISAAFRVIPPHIYTMEELGLPSIFEKIATYPNGLVLITGPTGSGKSTTLAAIIDYINHHHSKHIVTIEDPIEYVHQTHKCLIHQRELNRDTRSFHGALRAALREDPDVILVGELRDLDTIRLALTAAETGHLVFATLHTSSAAKSINRIIDVFSSGEKNFVRNVLSESLQAIIAQNLIKRAGGGRIAALEILLANAAIRNLIREDKIPQIYSVIQTSTGADMQTMDQHLKNLVLTGKISKETALATANDKQLF